MKNRSLKSGMAALAVALITMLGFAEAAAQGRYANVYSRADVSGFIRNLEESSDQFSRDFRNINNNGAYRRNVENFENAVDRLRSNFDRSDNWWNSRRDVQSIMDESQRVNVMMNNQQFARVLERQWNRLRRDINRLADTYELPGLGGGGNGGVWQGGGPTSNPPSWATGTFYGRDPSTGQRITLTISGNGQVTSSSEGNVSYGTYYNRSIRMEGVVARVDQAGNGIRVVRNDTRVGAIYTRGGSTGGENTTRPPSWAVGTFYTRDPATGRRVTLTIANNGQVTSRSAGSTSYGSYYNDTINMEGVTVRVDRAGNGIRTTQTDTGMVVTYTRN